MFVHRSSRIGFFLALIVATLLLGGVILWEGGAFTRSPLTPENPPPLNAAVEAMALAAEYRQVVHGQVTLFQDQEGAIPLTAAMSAEDRAAWAETVSSIVGALLDARVPAAERDFHLQLVLRFDALRRLLEAEPFDAEALAAARDQVVELLTPTGGAQ